MNNEIETRKQARIMMILGAATWRFHQHEQCGCPNEFNENIRIVCRKWGEEDLIEDVIEAAWS